MSTEAKQLHGRRAQSMNAKHFVFIGVGALLLIGAALQFAPSANRRYRADAMVIASPYTNCFFSRSFETHIVQTIPGVLRLRVTPMFSAIPGSGTPVLTNGVGIGIIAVGPTAQEAQRAANEAAMQLCRTVSTNYGVTAGLVDRATSARRYSFFHDSFQPGVAKVFKH